jgi:hypothetical protein
MRRAANSATRFFTQLMLLAATLASPSAIDAQTSVSASDLRRCADMGRGAERLDCFDALVRALNPEAPAQKPAPESSAEPVSAAELGVDAFGSELIADESIDLPREVHSRLVGEFAGWRGNTVFRLANGQIWRQAGEARLVYNADAPLITIRRGAFGSYRLSVEGIKSTVRVRRIR